MARSLCLGTIGTIFLVGTALASCLSWCFSAAVARLQQHADSLDACRLIGNLQLGKASDWMGRKPVLLLCLLGGGLGNLMAGWAWDFNSLILFRCVPLSRAGEPSRAMIVRSVCQALSRERPICYQLDLAAVDAFRLSLVHSSKRFLHSARECIAFDASLNCVCANPDTFVSRCVTGLFNGSSAVAIAFLSDICSGQERSDLVARQGALQAGAFIIGPCFGGVLTSISPLVSVLLLCRVSSLGVQCLHITCQGGILFYH